MLDRIDNLFDDCASSGIDPLFCSTAGECSEKSLLAPDGFFPCALVANVVTHGQEQRISFVVTATQAEQEGPKYSICN